MNYVLKIGGRILSAIIMTAAIAFLCVPALAVDDGLGTNVMKNIRIQTDGVIELNGDPINDWGDISGGDVTDLKAATNALNTRVGTLETDSTALKGATNALNTRVGTSETDVTGLKGATNALDTSVTALKGATNALNTRVGTAETDIGTVETDVGTLQTDVGTLQTDSTALKGATNALNTRVGTAETDIGTVETDVGILQTDSTALKGATNALNSGKYDKTGGTISGDMTLTGKAIYTPYAQTIISDSTTITVANAVAKIGTDAAARDLNGCTKQIAAGTAGQFLTVICTNTSVKLNNGNGLVLAEGVSFTMKANDVIQFVYDGVANWFEVHRTDN